MSVKQYNGILIDYSRDKDLKEQGLTLLTRKGFYKKSHENSPQETFARPSVCYSFGDYEFAQRMYNYASRLWFVNASPVMSNAVDIDWPSFTEDQFEEAAEWLEENVIPDGMPISCFLSYIADNKEGLVEARKETAWLSMMGGGIGVYAANRSPDEKSTGVMAHMKGYDADALSYKQTECYSPDMEILTSEGWVRFDRVSKDAIVAAVDSKGNLTFEKPERWTEYDYNGDMVRIQSNRKGLNLFVTPNHELTIQRKRKGVWSDFEKIEAKDLKLHNEVKFVCASSFNGDTGELSPLERLMIAHQADGHNYKQGQQIGFHFSKERKKDRLVEILNDAGIEYTLSGGDSYRLYVKHNHLPKNLDWIDLSEVSPQKAKAFLEEISYWDGYRNNKEQVSFSSVDIKAVEKVQCLAFIAGLGTSSICEYEPKQEGWGTVYSIVVNTRPHFLAEKLEKSFEAYEGKVYCCTVSTGNIVVRAGKVPLVCGNSRRGSIAGYLDITHPEVMAFIDMRNPAGGESSKKCFNLNNAVNLPDSFMEAVVWGDKYELIDPKHGPTGDYLDAREVWEKVLELRSSDTGEPYLNFIDTVNRARRPWITNPMYHVSQSNLCNEIHLMTSPTRTAVCCLSSVNLAKFDEWKDDPLFIKDMVRYLDNVLEYFIRLAPPQLKRAVHSATKERAIGLGTLGFHSYLQSKMIPFESGGFNSAAQMNMIIYQHIEEKAIAASRELAKTRGEPDDVKGSGMHNSHLIAIAPNASSSNIVGVSPSIEPWADNVFVTEGRAGAFLVKNEYLEALLEEKGKNTDEVWKQIMEDKSVRNLDFLSDHEKSVFKTFREINPMWIIEHAAMRQPHICQGQSVNLAHDNTWSAQEISDVHMAAWKKGLKGLYYFRGKSAKQANVGTGRDKPLNALPVRQTIEFDTCLSCEG